MKCEWCGTVFCWDTADEITIKGYRKRFCGEACQKKYQKKHSASNKASKKRTKRRARAARDPLSCARQGKIRYEDAGTARAAGEYYRRMAGGATRPYECACGGWHLTSEAQEARS